MARKASLSQVLNLTFDPCFKLNEVTLKRPYFSLIIGAMASDCKDTMKSKGRGREIVNAFHTCVCASVCASVRQVFT